MGQVSGVPTGRGSDLGLPGVETPGYCQTSLRDVSTANEMEAFHDRAGASAAPDSGPRGTVDNSPPLLRRVSGAAESVLEARLNLRTTCVNDRIPTCLVDSLFGNSTSVLVVRH